MIQGSGYFFAGLPVITAAIGGCVGGVVVHPVFHFDIVVPQIYAHDSDFHEPFGNLSQNFHRQIIVVSDLQIRGAPVDGGVQTQGDIAGREAVVLSLHNGQLCEQRTEIQSGGHLADAAAHLIHQFCAGIGGSGLIPGFGGSFSKGFVVGQGFSWL